MNLDLLTNCHSQLAHLLGDSAEPLSVVSLVEKHRWHWRPAQSRLILLAESHVYTPEAETKSLIQHSSLAPTMPREFVRLVYCLGYGESSILSRPPLAKNTGTPQFWKIFKSCVTDPAQTPTDFSDIQASQTPDGQTRIANKLRVLDKLRQQGTWLLDASIAALYRPGAQKPKPELRHGVITTSWNSYIRHTVSAAKPEAILVIGLNVARNLQPQLDKSGIPWDAVPQPQARLSSSEHAEVFSTYSRLAHNPRRIHDVSRRWLEPRRPRTIVVSASA